MGPEDEFPYKMSSRGWVQNNIFTYSPGYAEVEFKFRLTKAELRSGS